MSGDPKARFRTHLNYIDSFAQLGGMTAMRPLDIVLSDLHEMSAPLLSDPKVGPIDFDQVHQSLRNAWSTELLLTLPGEWASDDEFFRLSNTWGVVQTYYVGYHATQALLLAKNTKRPDNHSKTQKQFVALWVNPPLHIPPWTFGATASGWKNLAAGEVIDNTINSLTSCSVSNRWSLAAKALQTTRKGEVVKSIDRKREEKRKTRVKVWLEEEADRKNHGLRARRLPKNTRPQLNSEERTAAEKEVRTYTLLDYLYRLRIGANYGDAAVFFDGPTADYESASVHRNLVFLAAGTMLLSEIRIANLVGRTKLQRWGKDFVSSCLPARHSSIGVAARASLW